MSGYTVAIPCFNNAATVAYVVRAARGQNPPPERVLVCDDGSRDDSARVAREAGAEVLAHPENRGLAATRNTLSAACRTEHLVYFDADAIPQANCAAAFLAALGEKEFVAVGGRGVEVGAVTFADRWRARVTPQSHGESDLDDDWMVMGLCCAFRVAALREAGGFDPSFTDCGEDVDISLRLRALGEKLAYRPEAVVEHARNDNVGGLLRQAWRHSVQTARAFRRQGRSPGFVFRLVWRALRPAMWADLRRLDLPSFLLSGANLAVRFAGLLYGGLK